MCFQFKILCGNLMNKMITRFLAHGSLQLDFSWKGARARRCTVNLHLPQYSYQSTFCKGYKVCSLRILEENTRIFLGSRPADLAIIWDHMGSEKSAKRLEMNVIIVCFIDILRQNIFIKYLENDPT